MEDAVVTTGERGSSKYAGKCATETGTVCKKSLVMPPNTMVLDVEDVLYYNENKNAYDINKRSPYLIYLSTDFRTEIKRRTRNKVAWIILYVVFGMFCFLVLAFLLRLMTK